MDVLLRWKLQIAGGVTLLTSIIIYLAWLHYQKKRAEKLCGHYVFMLRGYPVIGSLLTLFGLHSSKDMWNFVTDCSIKYGQGMLLWLCHIPWLFVRELDVVEAVLSSSESIEKSHVYRLLDTVTDGVFSANGNRWKKLRKKLNLTFSQKQLDFLYSDINDLTPIFVATLNKNTDKYINIISFMTPFFFDLVCRSHFGVATEEQLNRHMHVTENAAKVIELTVENRVFKPQNHLLLLFKMTRANQCIHYLREVPIACIQKIIGIRLDKMNLEKANGVYESIKRTYYVDVAKEALEELNIEPTLYNMERNTSDMLVAASDTTSITVSAVFYYLALYPEIQEKVYKEVLSIFGESRTKELTKDDINNMEYMEMVLKETLRHTAPPGIIRELSKDLDVGKYIIPKKTNVYLILKAIHKSPEFYEKAEEFYPEHFLPEAVKNRPKFAFLAFSSGPRNCPGMTYSYVSMKAVIAHVVRNFKLETNIPLKDIRYKMVLMQEHTNGYFVKLTAR